MRNGSSGRRNASTGLRWSRVFAALAAGYVLLTALYLWLGYLGRIDERIRGTDSVYYYIYVRSLLFDGDLDFSNELEFFYGRPDIQGTTTTGLPPNVFSVGPALLWSPCFIVAHVATLLGQSFVSELEADGYSALYQSFVYIGNSLYGLAGILLTALS